MELERIVKELPEYLHCVVCLESAWEPFKVCKSEHVLCTNCTRDLLATPRPLCPTCRTHALRPPTISEALRRAVLSYQVRCREKRCKWVGTIDDEKVHRKECEFRSGACTQCRAAICQADARAHGKVCPEGMIACERGGPSCGGPGKGVFKRKQKKAHAEVCSNHPCTVSTTCETRTTLSNIVSHERQCKHAQDELKAAQAEVKRLKALLQPAAAAAAAAAGPAPPPKPQASGSAVRFHPHPAAFGLPPPRIKRSAAPSLADEEEPPSKRRSSR